MKKAVLVIAVLAGGWCLGMAQIRRGPDIPAVQNIVTDAQHAALTRIQSIAGNVEVAWSETNATPIQLAGRLEGAGYLRSFAAPRDAAVAYIAQNRDLFRLSDPAHELMELRAENDALGMTHVRLQQIYQGLRVVGAQIVAHFAVDGSLVSVNGRFTPTPQLSAAPVVTSAQARAAAGAAVKVQPVSAELVVYLSNDVPVLAYEVKLPTLIAPLQRATVDAITGAVVDIDDGIRYDGPDVGSGPGVSGTVRSLNIYLQSTTYYLIDATKVMYVPPVTNLKGVVATYDAHNDTIDANPYALAMLVTDPNGDKVFNDNTSLPAAVDAHYFTGKVYDYYRTHFGRNSWDNSGGSLTNVVHYLSHYNNAFWNGMFMSYGDGDGIEFSNLAGAFDVTAHEITHGVTQSTANLEYRGQSGALNESYSDVMACMADTANWTIAEDVYTPLTPGDALRDLSNPNQGGSGLADPGWQPATMSEYVQLYPYTSLSDNGGVHINSGIPNHAAYYVATAIGRTKTEQIYFNTLAYYLTPKSLFIDARILSLQAAANLYGAGGTEYNAVANAFDNVGITSTLPRTDELSYDDGSPSTGIYETDANWGIANRMTTTAAGTLTFAEFFYRGDSSPSGNGSFVLKVFDDNAGQPGNNLYTSNLLTPSPSAVGKWIVISFSNPVSVGQNFYVGIFYDATNRPMIGADTTANGRAWEWDATTQTWVILDQNSYFPVTVFIRAVVSTPTGVPAASEGVPATVALAQNYPNQFNPETVISYQLSVASQAHLAVYDLLGREVAALVNEMKQPGRYSVIFDGSKLPSGTYFYRLQSGTLVQTKKLMLLK